MGVLARGVHPEGTDTESARANEGGNLMYLGGGIVGLILLILLILLLTGNL
jgi:hypothetical protein